MRMGIKWGANCDIIIVKLTSICFRREEGRRNEKSKVYQFTNDIHHARRNDDSDDDICR